MRINRRLLYIGVFLVAAGGVLVAADLGNLDSARIADALRLAPLALVAIGVGIVLRRTRFGLAGGMLAAALPGLVIGGGFALAPRFALDCGGVGAPAGVVAHDGTFDGPARVAVSTACGSLVVTTAPGGAWRFDDGSATDRPAVIAADARSLSIDAGRHEGWHFRDTGADDWTLTLPTSQIENLSLDVNAGQGRIGLPGAQLGHLDITTNAAQTTVDLTGASVASLTGSVNAGLLSFHLPDATDSTGSLDVNAGDLQICAPADLGLRVHHSGALSGLSVAGHAQPGSDWTSPNYASAAHHADLTVDVNLGSVTIEPIGGCK